MRLFALLNAVAAIVCALVAFFLMRFVMRAWTFAIVAGLLAFFSFRLWRAARDGWQRGPRR
ncbi:MAG: hypothetical protein KGM44_02065 [bacterium]|nr:hypothetical protein [bacterium]